MRLLFIVAFLLQFFVFAQTQNTDSLSSAVDSSQKRLNELTAAYDSVQNKKNLEEFLKPLAEREEKLKTQTIIYIGLGMAFLAVLIIVVKKSRQ